MAALPARLSKEKDALWIARGKRTFFYLCIEMMVEESSWYAISGDSLENRISENFDEKHRKNWKHTVFLSRCSTQSVKKEIIDVFLARKKHLNFLRCRDICFDQVHTRWTVGKIELAENLSIRLCTIAGKKLMQDIERCEHCHPEKRKIIEPPDVYEEDYYRNTCMDIPVFDVALYDLDPTCERELETVITPQDLGVYILDRSAHDPDIKWFSWSGGRCFSTETLYGDNFACSLHINRLTSDSDEYTRATRLTINVRCWLKNEVKHKIVHINQTIKMFDDFKPLLDFLTACPKQKKSRFDFTLQTLCAEQVWRQQGSKLEGLQHEPVKRMMKDVERTRDHLSIHLPSVFDRFIGYHLNLDPLRTRQPRFWKGSIFDPQPPPPPPEDESESDD